MPEPWFLTYVLDVCPGCTWREENARTMVFNLCPGCTWREEIPETWFLTYVMDVLGGKKVPEPWF